MDLTCIYLDTFVKIRIWSVAHRIKILHHHE